MDNDKLSLLIQDVSKLSDKFAAFIDQYELDMRGDKDLTNGNRGIVGEIRDIKKYHKDYPSLTWLLKNRTVSTISAILFVFLFLTIIYQVGVFKYIAPYFGIPISFP